VGSPRWLADEMVGRLARYLRFAGCDTVYVRGLTDEEILDEARREDRVILTRDRRLAGRAPRSLLLTSPFIADQWREVRAAYPGIPSTVTFDRCTECNGSLVRVPPSSPPSGPSVPVDGVPWDRVALGLELYRCSACNHYYWEGSHTADVRARLARWAQEPPP